MYGKLQQIKHTSIAHIFVHSIFNYWTSMLDLLDSQLIGVRKRERRWILIHHSSIWLRTNLFCCPFAQYHIRLFIIDNAGLFF